MVFKFEMLIFLLVIGSALTAETVPNIPNINVESPLRHLTQLRRSLLHIPQNTVNSVDSHRALRYVEAVESSCAWDLEKENCSISITTTKRILQNSNTTFSEILTNDLDCAARRNKVGCNWDQKCFWDMEHSLCLLTDLRTGHENSPCIKAAPLLFRFVAAMGTCGKPNNKLTCNKIPECEWTSSKYSCGPDPIQIFFGVDHFTEKSAKVTKQRMPSILFSFLQYKNSDHFSWDSLLKWEPPKTDCPANTEKLVCTYVDAMYAVLIGPMLYCSVKYTSISDCNADKNCNFNWKTNTCGVTDSKLMESAVVGTNVLTATLPEGIDKEFIQLSVKCTSVLEQTDCNGGCNWNHAAKRCDPRTHHLGKILKGMPLDSDDGVCKFLNIDEASECVVAKDKDTCQKLDSCLWYQAHGCVASPDYFLSAAGKEDPKLKKEYNEEKSKCAKFKTQETCSDSETGSNVFAFSI